MGTNFGNSLFSLKAICFLVVFVLGCSAAPPPNPICPFNYFFHTGDGYFDTGNAILLERNLPASRLPYGRSCPGSPTGRWSDGFLDVDIGGHAMGFSDIKPYWGGVTPDDSAVNFAVSGSTVLDREFFTERGVKIPSYGAPLSTQLVWFQDYLRTVCSTQTECAAILADSMFLFGDIDANDVAMPLTQGKTFSEVLGYVPIINEAQIHAAEIVLRMGATRVILMGNVPIGCYPYILTELGTGQPEDYDKFGCLVKVNNLMQLKNHDLETRTNELAAKYPGRIVNYADFYGVYQTVLQETLQGPNADKALKACCGIGGQYNFDRNRFCGSPGVPYCQHPDQYMHWDGMHLTQDAHNRIMNILKAGIAPTFDCIETPPPDDICHANNRPVSSYFI